MKQIVYLIITVNILIGIAVTAQTRKNGPGLLQITGAALLNDQRASNYAVSVYLDGTMIDSLFTRSKNAINFYVNYNKVYTFLFQKKNCIDKIVIVNTQIPSGLNRMEDNTFDFEVEMSQSLSKKSANMEDYPIAILLINKEDEMLQASADYNRITHNEPEILRSNKSGKKREPRLDKK